MISIRRVIHLDRFDCIPLTIKLPRHQEALRIPAVEKLFQATGGIVSQHAGDAICR